MFLKFGIYDQNDEFDFNVLEYYLLKNNYSLDSILFASKCRLIDYYQKDLHHSRETYDLKLIQIFHNDPYKDYFYFSTIFLVFLKDYYLVVNYKEQSEENKLLARIFYNKIDNEHDLFEHLKLPYSSILSYKRDINGYSDGGHLLFYPYSHKLNYDSSPKIRLKFNFYLNLEYKSKTKKIKYLSNNTFYLFPNDLNYLETLKIFEKHNIILNK